MKTIASGNTHSVAAGWQSEVQMVYSRGEQDDCVVVLSPLLDDDLEDCVSIKTLGNDALGTDGWRIIYVLPSALYEEWVTVVRPNQM